MSEDIGNRETAISPRWFVRASDWARYQRFVCLTSIHKFVLSLQFHTPAKRFMGPRYPYNFSPQQLCFLCKMLKRTQSVAGNIAEIGCERGHTTLYLSTFLESAQSEKQYFAVDTFRGFVRQDIEVEVHDRGKEHWMYSAFQINRKSWFEYGMGRLRKQRVSAIEADVNHMDLRALGPLSFALLHVDLYRPTAKALPELYECLSPGGVLIVDDCSPKDFYWDGALQAYLEFMKSLGREPRIVHAKLGIVRKPRDTVAGPIHLPA